MIVVFIHSLFYSKFSIYDLMSRKTTRIVRDLVKLKIDDWIMVGHTF